ncbi:GNAT family N-acetyltransferase [Roseospira goensis]|uniref:GNAT family N-acetyltransferase n=1 Tax=Roseospira goensis TaxID=391922 RepID=A0A7W6S449_9PROT|nr:GNAT family N-acetyltransferase [Roseospira goensis]MBB4287817.1 hypothetical protein [Roseospira goensis]
MTGADATPTPDPAADLAPDLAFDWTSPADEAGLMALFRDAFGADMDPRLWAWKYYTPGNGGMVARRGGAMVAHYGGQARRLEVAGAPLTAMWIGDSMVHPRERGRLRRDNAFGRLGRTFIEAVTVPAGPHAFVYGFPSPRAARLGQLLGLYARVDRLDVLVWSGPGRTPGRRRVRPMTLDGLVAAGDDLWRRQRAGLPRDVAVTVRDGAFLAARYAAHPLHRYEVLVRCEGWRRRPMAAAVIRAQAEAVELLDLLGDVGAYPLLVDAVRDLAVARGLPAVFAWATPSLAAVLPAPERREMVHEVNIAGPDLAANTARLADRCWMGGGDSDDR